jgi:DNA-binding response OmpR family regulator
MDHVRPVLVLEDDIGVAQTIANALVRDGWRTDMAATLAEARVRLREDKPRIAIVDIGLPDGNGITFVREAAAQTDIGIIVVSGRSDEVDRVVGLEVGADDYLSKPFSLREMVARVRALSRRLDAISAAAPVRAAAVAPDPSNRNFGGVQLEPSRLRVIGVDGSETRLTGGEAGLLSLLMESPENLAKRETISDKVLGRRLMPEQRGVDQLASNLRQKLLAASGDQMTVTAVRGQGYRLIW